MPVPENRFKTRLLAGDTLIGCWLNLADGYAAEIMGTAGFDWLVIDGEHGPNDLVTIREQMTALAASPSEPVVRVPMDEPWLFKQLLDIGVRTFLVPNVESAEQAEAIVAACRYPPAGIRGAGAALGRASRFGEIADYMAGADGQICILVQIESRKGLDALEDIAAVEGVDGLFIGPWDLSTDMGFVGNPAAPEMRETIRTGLSRIKATGKAPGILAIDDATIERYLEEGARFIGVGADVAILAMTARALAAKWTR